MTKTIQIHNIENLTEENIELFFESARNGGGEIKHCKCFQAEGHALLEFKEVLGNVDRRPHKSLHRANVCSFLSESQFPPLDLSPVIYSVFFPFSIFIKDVPWYLCLYSMH